MSPAGWAVRLPARAPRVVARRLRAGRHTPARVCATCLDRIRHDHSAAESRLLVDRRVVARDRGRHARVAQILHVMDRTDGCEMQMHL